MASSAGAWPAAIPHETLDQAAELGHISPGVSLQEEGSIGDGPDGAADVVWYRFTLEAPALVHFGLSRQDPSSTFDGVLSLFNNDPNDFMDPYDLNGYRMVEQVDAAADGGVASFDRLLGQGTYFLAVSGDGNFYFNPLLAGSGIPGSTGGFDLQMSASDAGLGSAIGPQVLTSDPAPGATLSASPLAIRIDLSDAIDPSTIAAGQNVQLLYSPDGQFALDGQQVQLLSTNFSPVVVAQTPPGGDAPEYQGLDELQLFPAGALAMGYYEVVLVGKGSPGSPALADYQGNALGADAANPQGQDITIPFQVDGIEGRTGANAVEDDTPDTAQQLGDLTTAGLVQVAGAIGDDPGPDTSGMPANQVDLYHFTVTGAGDNSLVAEVFAGRIGSPLEAGLSLFRLDPTTGSLVFVAGDISSYDTVETTNGQQPLLTDSVLYASLAPGDYYLAVAGATNTPSPYEGQYYDVSVDPAVTPPTLQDIPPYPTYGLYDPNIPGSAQDGWSTGSYVLSLLVQPSSKPPQVLATSVSPGETLTQPPTQLTVTFDQPMNLEQLAFQSYQATSQDSTATVYDTLPGVYIESADGTPYIPRFESYDAATNQATFVMLNALPNGNYELHLSGADGLADLGGLALVGNDPSGDYVVPFTVDAPPRSGEVAPGEYNDQEPNDTIAQAQNLGPLFPDEMSGVNAVTLSRDFSQDPAAAPQDTADVYEFQILLDRYYSISLAGADLPAGVALSLTDASGNPVEIGSYAGGTMLLGPLSVGTYFLKVGDWSSSEAASVSYVVDLTLGEQNDNAPPLISGPAPAVAIQLADAETPTSPVAPPTVTPPTVTPPTVTPPESGPPTVADPPPVDSSTSGTGASTVSASSSTTTTAPGVLSLAIPSQSPAGAAYYGAVTTSVAALAASPVGGVVGPGGAESASAVLVQSNAVASQSSLITGLIMVGTSLHLLEPGEAIGPAPVPSEPESPTVADPMTEVRDWGALIAFAGASLHGVGLGSPGESPAAEDPGETPASPRGVQVGSLPVEATVEAPPAESPPVEAPADSRPGERVRVVILAFTAMAVGAYVRCRGLVRRDGGHERVRGPARPELTTRRISPATGIGRSQA